MASALRGSARRLASGAAVCAITTVSPSTVCTVALVSMASVLRLFFRTTPSRSDHSLRTPAASIAPLAARSRRRRRLAAAGSGEPAAGPVLCCRRRGLFRSGRLGGPGVAAPARERAASAGSVARDCLRRSRCRRGGVPDLGGRHPAFHAFQALQYGRVGDRVGRHRGRQQHPRAQQFQQQPGRGGAAHVDQAGVHDLGEPGQRRRARAVRPAPAIRSSSSPGALTSPRAPASGTARSSTRSRNRSSRSDGEPARVVAGLDQPVDRAVHGAGVAGGQAVDHVVDQRHVGDAEQRHRPVVGHALRARRRQAAGRAPTACPGPNHRRRG